ncbi:unnamed protein product [Plutella xylostella]|uniref:(diamondback moth) hypothetical protein n=1 Tax=Plutella xylostella TaxID=51655 RepID=A0A8S4ES93_PLUXY|nr:unnamed protein product [Plutella xylostella]
MDCEACQQKIEDKQQFLVCTVKGCFKHYHIACTTTSQSAPIDTNTWICQDCICAKKKGGDNSATPVRSAPSNITQRKSKPKSKGDLPLDDYSNEIRLLRKEMASSTEKRTALNEIIGLPESRNENLLHSVLVISKKIGVNLTESDIDGINRVGPRLGLQDLGGQKIGRPSPRPVVVRLLRKVQRDNLLKSAKSRRNLTTTDIEMEGPAHQIYINERLTRATNQLFRDARERNKSTGYYKHCWVSGGRLYLRRVDGSPALSIGSHEELDRSFNEVKKSQAGGVRENHTA